MRKSANFSRMTCAGCFGARPGFVSASPDGGAEAPLTPTGGMPAWTFVSAVFGPLASMGAAVWSMTGSWRLLLERLDERLERFLVLFNQFGRAGDHDRPGAARIDGHDHGDDVILRRRPFLV